MENPNIKMDKIRATPMTNGHTSFIYLWQLRQKDDELHQQNIFFGNLATKWGYNGEIDVGKLG